MNTEIERKFLVSPSKVPGLTSQALDTLKIKQAFLSLDPMVRLRISNSSAFITVKGKKSGISCSEVEAEIPLDSALRLWPAAKFPMEKTRYVLALSSGLKAELDVFEGFLSGLVVVEVELPKEDFKLNLPDWFGKEVSENYAYTNVNLAQFGLPVLQTI